MVGGDAGLAAIIRAALIGIVVVRRSDGMLVEANATFTAALGWSPDEVIGRTTVEIDLYVDPGTRKRLYDTFERDGKVVRMEVLVRTRSGTHATFLLSMHPLTFGGQPCAVALWEDVTEIRRVDAALQHSEEQLRAMFELASVGITQIEIPSHRYLRVNPTMCEITGYSAEELYERTVDEITYPADRPTDDAMFADFAAGRCATGHVEKRYVRKDGRLVWCSVDCRLVEGRAVAIVVDITSRRATARALEEAEERSRLALDAAELGTWRYDIANSEFHLDARAQHQFGVQRALLCDADMYAVMPPEDRKRFADAIATASTPGATGRVTIEHRVVLHDDQVRWLAVHIRVVFTGEEASRVPTFALAACRDITASRAAAEALRASEDRYRNLVDNLDDVVFSLDLAGCLTFVSRAISRFGYEPALMLGRSIADFVHPGDRLQLRQNLARRFAGSTDTDELRWLDATGSTRYLRSSTRPMFVGGRVAGITGLFTDVTQQRETEEQLRAAQRMEAVGRLAGGVAHDFNNIVSVILSYTELASDNLPADSPILDDLAEIGNAATRAAGLTRQLLAFSRCQVLDPERVDLGALTSSLTNMLRRLIGEDIELQVENDENLFAVIVDKGQLEQVVMNLAVNARDAMTEGGVLRITTRNATLDATTAASLEVAPGDYVELAITDSGTGIPEAVRKRIFEPFFTTKGVGKGTGLGLSMAHGMVKQSGGGISVDTEPGRGTTFHVFLPRDHSPSPQPLTASANPSLATRGHERILLVEDDAKLRSAISRVLASVGYDVVAASNAAEALEICERDHGRFDLVLTDVVMPGIDGKRLVERLRASGDRAKVLYMSGYTDEAIEHRGVLDFHFLRKPFAREVLTEKVRSVLDGPG